MLFKTSFHAGIASGAVQRSYRRWKAARVKAGGRYGVGRIGLIEVDAVTTLPLQAISEADARASGYDDLAGLHRALAGGRSASSRPLDPAEPIHRVDFHYLGPDSRMPAPDRSTPDAGDLETLLAKLDAMDRRSKRGPWTRPTLRAIAERPRVAASKLAPTFELETPVFKADVRKLKRLGLTISHETGYELSPRGRALLRASSSD